MGKKQIKCDWCNQDFFKYESKIGKNNFCCREHYLAFHSKDVPLCICEICGKDFKGTKYNANRFCSRECYEIYWKIPDKIRICPTCGKEFEAIHRDDKFCSQKCHLDNNHNIFKGENHPNWKGGITSENEKLRKSKEYLEWREQVLKRDNEQCIYCGKKDDKMNAHHILAWQFYPNLRFNVSNGVTVCQECHKKIHNIFGYNSKEKMLLNEVKI